MPNPDVERRYEERFGRSVPFIYFDERDRALAAAEEAVDRGEDFTVEDWLRKAGYSQQAVRDIMNSRLVL